MGQFLIKLYLLFDKAQHPIKLKINMVNFFHFLFVISREKVNTCNFLIKNSTNVILFYLRLPQYNKLNKIMI